MTARIDTYVKAVQPVVAIGAKATSVGAPGQPRSGSRLAPEERARRHEQAQERLLCWKAISEAGGIDKWIADELRNKGLSTEGLESPTDRDKAQYKAKKKAEAEE